MEYINISHKRDHEYKIHAVSSEQHESHSVFNVQREKGHWSSRKSDENMQEYIILDFQGNVTVDFVEMAPSPSGAKTFPRDFRFEGSLDGNCWMVIHTEKKLELDDEPYRLDIPLTLVRYLKILIITNQQQDGKYFSEIGRIRAGVAGVAEIRASSVAAKDRGTDCLLADTPDSYWESEPKSHAEKETLTIDLGTIYHVNRIILGSASRGFPENIFIETSSDNNVWMPLLEEKNFKAQGEQEVFLEHRHHAGAVHPHRGEKHEIPGRKYGVQLSLLEISAAPFNPFHTHNIGDLTPYASIFQAGIVRLAKDGDDAPGTGVQANDRRLRDATAIFKGIVQLAEDGADAPGLAVQASDSRLRPATDLKHGTARLAHNRETKAGTVVQGKRFPAPGGDAEQFRHRQALPRRHVQGQRCGHRQRPAPAQGNGGILRDQQARGRRVDRAGNGGTGERPAPPELDDRLSGDHRAGGRRRGREGVVVQGNDKRIKDASTQAKGIVELAEDGENKAGVAVQGRRPATQGRLHAGKRHRGTGGGRREQGRRRGAGKRPATQGRHRGRHRHSPACGERRDEGRRRRAGER